MTSILDNYKKRVGVGAKDAREYTVKEIERNFLEYLHTSPTCHEVKMTDPEEVEITDSTKTVLCSINDLTQNDKRALDEKKVLVPRETNVDVGCYFFWDNCYWIIIFKEHKTLETYKKFIARRCNQILNYKLNGKVYKIPISIENLTMYSDGLADLKYTSQQDSKRMFTFGSNPVTRTIIANTRVMLTGKTVFRVTHINDFEYNGAFTGAHGIIKTLVLQTTLIEGDDLKNNIAYNEGVSDAIKPVEKLSIKGDSFIMTGGKRTYTMEGFDSATMSWKIKAKEGFATTTVNRDNSLSLQISSNVNYTGENVEIQVVSLADGEIISSLLVKSRGFV